MPGKVWTTFADSRNDPRIASIYRGYKQGLSSTSLFLRSNIEVVRVVAVDGCQLPSVESYALALPWKPACRSPNSLVDYCQGYLRDRLSVRHRGQQASEPHDWFWVFNGSLVSVARKPVFPPRIPCTGLMVLWVVKHANEDI